MKTVSQDYNTKQGWTLTTDSLSHIESNSYVDSNSKIYPCGCGVKVDLQEIVYPVTQTKDERIYINERVDVHFSSGSFEEIKRIVLRLDATQSELGKLAEEVMLFQPNFYLELISADFEKIDIESERKNKYEKLFNKKCEFIDEIKQRYQAKNLIYGVNFGKGHSVKAGGDFILLDFIRISPQPKINSAFNHDSIITADSVLSHSALTSTFVSLNNALNDLFSNGVFENIQIFPTYDGTSEEISKIQENIKLFVNFYKERGVEISVRDFGPLNLGLKLIGASVSGTTSKENRLFTQMKVKDHIVLTKHLGDLSFLSLYRSHYFRNREKKELLNKRLWVLQEMTTSNYLVAKIINKYLPKIGESHDPKRHISFSTDISGPGIDVLFEAAQASGVDIMLNNPVFLFPESLYFSRKNHTSSTNGPIAIVGAPDLVQILALELENMGFERKWALGKVY